MKNSKKIVILYGPPGSGKGTQAKLLADKLGFFHFDTGSFLRELLHDQKFQKNKTIQKERRLNDGGKLNTPSFVLKIVSQRAAELFKLKQSIVFSGSPRTLYEAFGDKKTKGLMALLSSYYSRSNIFIFALNIPENESILRNSNRSTCGVCQTTLLNQKLQDKHVKFKHCPFCGAKIVSRVDDNPKIIKTRLLEYKTRTKPIFKGLKKRGYKIYKIDGTPMPYKIHQKIVSYLPR